MKIIENKKLFGKVNLMDIIIIAVILVAGIIVYNIVFSSETSVNVGAQYFTTTCTIKLDDLPVGASEYLLTGADVYDNETNVYIGKLIEAKSGDYNMIKTNYEAGEFVETKVPNRETVYATVEVAVSDQGADLVTANNYFIKVGKYVSIRCQNFAGGGYITFVDREAK